MRGNLRLYDGQKFAGYPVQHIKFVATVTRHRIFICEISIRVDTAKIDFAVSILYLEYLII